MNKIFIYLCLVFLLVSCTENSRAKKFGGTAKLEVACGQKVTNITWKESQLWYSTIPMKPEDEPVTHNFTEESSFGIVEGNYLLIESKCN